jgi:membrane-associated phospholipid phosphatase
VIHAPCPPPERDKPAGVEGDVISRALPPPPPAGPPSVSPRALAIAGVVSLAIALAAFVSFAWNVESQTRLVAVDANLTAWLAAHRTPLLTAAMLVISQANGLTAIPLWTLLFAAVLTRLREWYWIMTLGLAVGGGIALNALLKAVFERARPHLDDPLLILDTYSFPSGHTAAATVFYGVLAAFLVSRTYRRSRRTAAVAGAIAAIVLVAFSRVYLGAHYFSDVVAAMCSSAAWLVLCLSSVHHLVRRRMAER